MSSWILPAARGFTHCFYHNLQGRPDWFMPLTSGKRDLRCWHSRPWKTRGADIATIKADATKEIEIEAHSLDLCLMATVLHDFKEMDAAQTVLKQVLTLLKPGGCLAVIEFKKMDGPPGPPAHIRLTREETEKECTQLGFKKIDTADMGEYNYMITFTSPE